MTRSSPVVIRLAVQAVLALLPAMAGVGVASAWADDGAERLTGNVPEEVEAFKATRERFDARVRELEADTLAALRLQKSEQLSAVERSYGARLATIEADETVMRADAIASMERFLRRYTDVASSSEVRLRLAELYFQEAEDAWFAESEAYEKAFADAEGDLDRMAELESRPEPRIDLTRVITLLTEITDLNRGLPRDKQYDLLDVAYYTLAWAYAEPNARQYDRDRAHEVFGELVGTRPNSDYADAAHLMRGLYDFEQNAFDDSIPEFEAVLARGAEASTGNAEGALYQLAWARYKLSEYDEAMRLFIQLLDLSQERRRTSGKPSNYEPEAITYLALSLVDVSDAESTTPLQASQTYFQRIGKDRPYRWDVLTELAASLDRYGRPLDAVDVYTYLQVDPAFRFRPENPEFQDKVVRLLSRGYESDLAAAGQARVDMTERYGEGSAWWNANRDDPDAQATARGFIEGYLLDVAIEFYVRARESGRAEDYAAAADKYREYLDRFPIADDYFDNQALLAQALYEAGRLPEAEAEYLSLTKNARFHKYGDLALYRLFLTRRQLMIDDAGPSDQRSAKALVERTYTTPEGKELVVYQLLDTQRAFVDAADEVLSHAFGPAVDNLDVGATVATERPKILYLGAQVLYYANRYEEARPRLQKVIKEYPSTDEALYAANLFLNTYINEGDGKSVRRWSQEFATLQLGKSAALSSQLEGVFKDSYEKATYAVGVDMYEAGDKAGAADAFLAFVDEFPKSPNAQQALLSAGNMYQELGRTNEANQLYERFLREYPDSPEAKPFYLRIASNYESTFQLDKAIDLYRKFLSRFGKSDEARTAQFQVAYLLEGKGDPLGAAQGYEAYARQYTDAADREDVNFMAGRMYELVSSDRAISFYRAYLKTYGAANPDHALQAQSRIAELYRAAGKSRDADKALDDVVSLYDRVLDAGGAPGPAGIDGAAAAAFRSVQSAYDSVVDKQLTRNEVKDAKLLLDTLPAEIKAFDERVAAFAVRYPSFEYTTAGLYLQGAARKFFAELGFKLEPPPGLNENQVEAYWALLEETMFPQMEGVEAQAVDKLKAVLALAKERKRHAIWVDRAATMLNDIDSAVYPAVKQPILGSVDAVEPPRLEPQLPPQGSQGGAR